MRQVTVPRLASALAPAPRSAGSVTPTWPRWVRASATWAVVIGAALVVATAAIHLNLWFMGYRHVPKVGGLFLAQAISGLILGPLLALTRRALFGLAMAVYMAASAGALILSATVGFLGVHDTLSAPWAGWALGVEIAGFVLLTPASGLLALRR